MSPTAAIHVRAAYDKHRKPIGIELLTAPPTSAISVELLRQADPRYLSVEGDTFTITHTCGVVRYRLVELIDDGRTWTASRIDE